MNKDQIIETIKKARELGGKKKFVQTFDLIINLKFIDIKKNSINNIVTLPFGKGKEPKICGFFDASMTKQAKEVLNEVIDKEDFAKWQDKAKLKKLAKSFDYFVAQSNLMPEIAKTFGKVLAPRGKMPNPKSGCIVPPGSNLKALSQKLTKSVKLETKNESIIKCSVGNENMKDEEIEENIMTVYNFLLHDLPKGGQNIKNIVLKLTMGKPVQVGKDDGKA